MKTFLRQVAEFYRDVNDIEDYCFVFPNRRSGQFFEKELSECFTTMHMMPRICTMQELLEELTPKVRVNPIEAIFTLYQAYSEVFGDKAESMDHFIYWSNIIINDFNDVDMALADPRSIYANVNDLREISTDYIDADLKKEIQRIFNIQISQINGLWKNAAYTSDGDTPKDKYFTLWEKLADIYFRYNELLSQHGQITQGALYRFVAQNADNLQWRYKRIIVVGFAAITVSEDQIFKAIKGMGGHFWWDHSAPVFASSGNSGINLVESLSKRFPSPIEIDKPEEQVPIVCTMSVPSGIGQAKWAMYVVRAIGDYSKIFYSLSLLFHSKDNPFLPIINLKNAINTAIVLPDDNLLVPVINSIPEGIERINITMGYPMRNAGIVSLMHLVARAHQQATLSKDRWMYFRDSVLDILSHPMVKSAFTSHVIKLQHYIDNSREFNIGEDVFSGTPLEHIFTTVHDLKNKDEVVAYVDRLIKFTQILDENTRSATGDEDSTILPLQSAFISHFISALKQLRVFLRNSNHLPAEDTSIFYLIDRATSSVTIPFTGEPLEGLQVMGMLETRNLDFENIIIPSMNERIFPTRRAMSSFIPDMIRNAYALPTNSVNEAATTYYFYRLLSRAKFALLIYDNSAQSYASGEPSRYISQLEKVYNLPINRVHVNANIIPSSELEINVKKSQEVADMWWGEGKKALSASAINGYINCPMQFYFQRVQGFNNDNNESDFMDAATLGTIVHNSLQSFYYPKTITDKKPRIITTEMIDDFKKNHLNTTVIREINKVHLNKPDDQLDTPLNGDAFILQETIHTFINKALEYDKQLIAEQGPITVLECEEPHKADIDIQGTKFNFSFTIDRLDKVGDKLRIVDYKTGKDSTLFKSIEELFDSNKGFERPHAILQLLLYCNAWLTIDKTVTQIQPVIYKLRDIDKTGIYLNDKQYTFTPDDTINKEFMAMMKDIIGKMQDINTPFEQTPNKDICKHCRFADFCRR